MHLRSHSPEMDSDRSMIVLSGVAVFDGSKLEVGEACGGKIMWHGRHGVTDAREALERILKAHRELRVAVLQYNDYAKLLYGKGGAGG